MEKVKVEAAARNYKEEYKKFQSSTKAKKYRAELNKYNRQKGTYGNGDGKDASHKGGKIVGFESQSKNRGRAEKSRLKKEQSYRYGSGDIVKDVNPTCPHFGAIGKVKKVKPNSVVFVVTNKGQNFKPGQELEKSHDQMKKMNEVINERVSSSDFNKDWIKAMNLVITQANNLKGQLAKHPIKRNINKLKASLSLYKKFISPKVEKSERMIEYGVDLTKVKKELGQGRFKYVLEYCIVNKISSSSWKGNSFYFLDDKTQKLLERIAQELKKLVNLLDNAQLENINENKIYKVGDTVSLLSFDRRHRGRAKVKGVTKSRPNKFGIKNHYITNKGTFTDMEVEGTEAFKLRFKGNTEKQVTKAMQSPGSAITHESVNESYTLYHNGRPVTGFYTNAFPITKVVGTSTRSYISFKSEKAIKDDFKRVLSDVSKDDRFTKQDVQKLATMFKRMKIRKNESVKEAAKFSSNSKIRGAKGKLTPVPNEYVGKLGKVENTLKKILGYTNGKHNNIADWNWGYDSRQKMKPNDEFSSSIILRSHPYIKGGRRELQKGDVKTIITTLNKLLRANGLKIEKSKSIIYRPDVNSPMIEFRVEPKQFLESVKEDYKNSEWEVYLKDEKGREKIVKKAKSKRAATILYNKIIKSDAYYEVGMRAIKESVNEDGHTDVASSKRKVMIMVDDSNKLLNKLNGMNTEDSLPSWWTDKITLSQNYLEKATNYILNPVESINVDIGSGNVSAVQKGDDRRKKIATSGGDSEIVKEMSAKSKKIISKLGKKEKEVFLTMVDMLGFDQVMSDYKKDKKAFKQALKDMSESINEDTYIGYYKNKKVKINAKSDKEAHKQIAKKLNVPKKDYDITSVQNLTKKTKTIGDKLYIDSVNEVTTTTDKSIGTKNYKGVGWFWPSALWKHYLRDTSDKGRKVVHDLWLKAGFEVVTDKRGVPHFNIKPSQKNKAMKIVDTVEKRIPIKESVNEGSMDWEKDFKWANEKELKVIAKLVHMNNGIAPVIKMSKKPDFKSFIKRAAKKGLGESIDEAMNPSAIKKMRDEFEKTGDLPPHLKKFALDLKILKKKHKVKNIVVPGLEWMSDMKEVNEIRNNKEAQTAMNQIGNKALYMIGAKDFVTGTSDGKKSLVFKVMRNSKGVSHIRMRLSSMDLYDMDFLAIRAGKIKIKSKVKGVYGDQLGAMIKKNTGLNIRL